MIGITDKALSRTLQLDPELTLEKVTKRVRQTEAVQQQQQSALKETSSCKELVEVAALSKKTEEDSGSSVSNVDCSRCGRKHRRGKCPAFNAVCYRCHKRGHFQSCCKSRSIPTTPVGDQEDNSINTAFINTLGEEDSILWFVNLTLGNKEVSFKIDTGAEVTAVSEKVWKQSKRPRLQVPLKTLYGPAHEPFLL